MSASEQLAVVEEKGMSLLTCSYLNERRRSASIPLYYQAILDFLIQLPLLLSLSILSQIFLSSDLQHHHLIPYTQPMTSILLPLRKYVGEKSLSYRSNLHTFVHICIPMSACPLPPGEKDELPLFLVKADFHF